MASKQRHRARGDMEIRTVDLGAEELPMLPSFRVSEETRAELRRIKAEKKAHRQR